MQRCTASKIKHLYKKQLVVDQYFGASLIWGSSRFLVIFGIVMKIGRKWTVDSIFFRPFRPLLSHFKLLKKSDFVTFQLRCPLNWDKSFTLASIVGAKQSIFYLASVLSKGEKRYFRLNKRRPSRRLLLVMMFSLMLFIGRDGMQAYIYACPILLFLQFNNKCIK